MPKENAVEWQDVTPTKEPPPGFNHLILVWERRASTLAHYDWSGVEWRPINFVDDIPKEGLSVGAKDGNYELKDIIVSHVSRR